MLSTPRSIRSLDLVLTTACNLRCAYCYQDDKQRRRMDWETLRAGLDLLLSSAHAEVSVLFIGGEPLLELPLVRRAVEHLRSGARRRQRVKLSLTTNGLLLDEEGARFLAENRIATQLSFDGVPAAQVFRGPATFAPLDALLDRLRRDHRAFFEADLRVAIAVHSGNLEHLADSVAYLIEKGVSFINAGALFTHDPGWRPEHRATLAAQFARIFTRSLRLYRETGRIPFALFRRTERRSRRPWGGRAMCGVDRGEAITLDVDGQASGCVTFVESYQRFPSEFLRSRLESMRLGDVRDPAFSRRLALYPAAVREAEIFHGKGDKWSSYGRCGACPHLASCAVCPTAIGHIPGNTDPTRVPDHLCAFALVTAAYRDRFPRQPTAAEQLTRRGRVPDLLRELRGWAERRQNEQRD
jgi:sulfatase maturation enzyme AslB (radical SAM superfamily)